MSDLPGYEIEEALGECSGFDTSELGTTWTEICSYGTAVRARRL